MIPNAHLHRRMSTAKERRVKESLMAVDWQSDKPRRDGLVSKVPSVTLIFWVIKICATTVGETGGDAVSMTFKLGYAVSSVIFLGFFGLTLAVQVVAKRYHPFMYWAVVV